MAQSLSVSIVMPVRDAAATLAEALRSIRGQILTDWDLVVVNDGSIDGTGCLLTSAAHSEPRLRVLSQEPLGIAAALQRGCAAAHSTFIARMDADDVMVPDRLQLQREFLDRHPDIGLVSSLVVYGGNGTGYGEHVRWINSLLTPEQMELNRFVESPVAHPSVMFRRDLLQKHGGYASGEFPEDYELWLRWMDAGVRFGKVDASLLTWNDPATRLSRIDPRYSDESFYRLKCKYLARWLKRELDPARRVWLWGAGRITRRRFHTLEEEGVPIAGFIDVDTKKIGRMRDGRPVVGPDSLPSLESSFIIAGVGTRGARDLIAGRLSESGRRPGADFLLAA